MINEMTVALVMSVNFARMSRLNSHEMREIETSFTIKPFTGLKGLAGFTR